MIEKRKVIHQGRSAADEFCNAVAAGEGVAQEVNHAVEDVSCYIKVRSYGHSGRSCDSASESGIWALLGQNPIMRENSYPEKPRSE